jgi:hypothetical protein
MHKANTYYDEEQSYPFENSSSNHIEQPPTGTERKALHFFETGIDISNLFLSNQGNLFFQAIPREWFFI